MVDVINDEADPDEEREQLIDAIKESLTGVYGQIADLGFEVDNYLAEYRYDAVQEAIDSLTGLVNGGGVDDVEELAALRTHSAERPAASSDVAQVEIPRLTTK